MMLWDYLWQNRKLLLMLTLFAAVFAAVFALYGQSLEPVLYAAGLCLFIGLTLFIVGYCQYLRRHGDLRGLLARIASGVDRLPMPKGLVEADYQALLTALETEKARAVSRADAAQSEQSAYYTLWAHQVKTPIAAMRLLLQDGGEVDRAAVSAELFRIEQYVEMVLQYQRLEEGSDYVLRDCALDDIIRGALRKYAQLFIIKKLPVSFQETNLTVLTDEKWLSFVVEQVLSNALKYTRTGRISIFAEGETLVIADTGIGIAPEDLPRVFDRGYTGYNGRSDKKSTGIGLYLCRRVMDNLGHTIAVESAAGAGTTVRLGLARSDRVSE